MSAQNPSPTRPNVVIFMMDTQGSQNMSCYGYRRKTTPNIDRIAREGALFENHFVTGPWTLPVHASLFTSRYESGHGAGAQHEGLEPGLPCMGGIFSEAGYRTVAINNNYWAASLTESSPAKGFDETVHYCDPEIEPVAPFIPSDDPDEQDRGALKGVGICLKWIDDNHLNARRRKPFLMYFNAYDIHDPFYPPEPFRSQFMPEGWTYKELRREKSSQNPATIGDICPTFDEWQAQAALKDANTACVDDRIGRFVDELKARGIYDDTVFIITGDHGDCLGQHVGYACHSQNGVYDHACKTPLIVRYPKRFKARTRCKELVQIVDVLPTLMDLANVKDAESRNGMVGASLMDALKGPVRDFALIEAQRSIQTMRITWTASDDPENADPRFMNVWYKAARTKRYKYIWVSNGADMLFDTVRDPDERWNIIERKPEIARKLRRAMEEKLMSMEQRYYPDMMNRDRQLNFPPEDITYALRRLGAWGLYQPGPMPAWTAKTRREEIAKQKAWRKKRDHLIRNTQ